MIKSRTDLACGTLRGDAWQFDLSGVSTTVMLKSCLQCDRQENVPNKRKPWLRADLSTVPEASGHCSQSPLPPNLPGRSFPTGSSGIFFTPWLSSLPSTMGRAKEIMNHWRLKKKKSTVTTKLWNTWVAIQLKSLINNGKNGSLCNNTLEIPV